MMPEFKYPVTFLAVAVVFIYFAVKYFYSKEEIAGRLGIILFSLRLMLLVLLSVFAFDPEFIKENDRIIPLKTLVLIDNSRSVGLGERSDLELIKELAAFSLQNDELVPHLFGSGLRPLLSSDSLNNSDLFTLISGKDVTDAAERFSSLPDAGSIVLITDGNFNDADNFSLKQKLPVDIIFTSPVPDESDIFINELIYQENPSAGEEKKAAAVIGLRGFANEKELTLKILEKGKLIKTVKGIIPAQNSFINIPVELPLMDTDFRELEFSVSPLSNETNVYNNIRTAYQRKIASSEKLLIVSSSPSLDLSFFSKLLKDNGYRFEIITAQQADDIDNTAEYSALASFGLPDKNSKESLPRLFSAFSSKIIFVNKNTDLTKLDRLLGMALNNYRYVQSEAGIFSGADGEAGFLFRRENEFLEIENVPGTVYNSVFMPANKEFRPVIRYEGVSGSSAVYRNTAKGNSIIINASRIWDPLFNDRNGDFGKFMLNIIDLALTDPNADRIRIKPVKEEYVSGEKVVIKGKIFDASMREVKDAAAGLNINDKGTVTPFVYDGKNYTAELYLSEPGIYTASVVVRDAGGTETKKNLSFSVIENDSETAVIGSDTLFVKNFASVRNGRAVSLREGRKFLAEKTGRTIKVQDKEVFRLSRTFSFFTILTLIFLLEIAIRKYKDLS